MGVLLAATDLASPSYGVLYRAAILARQAKAPLVLLHVLEAAPEADAAAAARRLRNLAADLAPLADALPEIVVADGSARQAIAEAARDLGARLVLLGGPRARGACDLALGSTVARALCAARVPVLLVNRATIGPYRRVLIAADASEEAAHAVRAAEALGLLDEADVSVVHAFAPLAKGKLVYAGVSAATVEAWTADCAEETVQQLVLLLRREGLNIARRHVILDEAHPVPAIMAAARKHDAELLILGTQGHRGLKRFLLGTVAGEVARRAACDVLIVPGASTA